VVNTNFEIATAVQFNVLPLESVLPPVLRIEDSANLQALVLDLDGSRRVAIVLTDEDRREMARRLTGGVLIPS
jgi:hypothetical protein